MSVDYSWLICLPSEQEEKILKPLFDEAIHSATLSPQAQSILQQWKNNPEHFLDDFKTQGSAELYNQFVSAFVIDSIQQLWDSLATKNGKNGFKFNPDNCIDIFSINRCSIGAMFWCCLEPDLINQLPGFMGNIFLSRNEVPLAIQQVNHIFEIIDKQTLVHRQAKRLG